MKPIKLIFQGINSFSERTEIDFEGLLQNGLFGIFGKTGSGKSTILDCILFALYAKTSRSQTIREYVNSKCNSAYIDFTFEMLSDGKRRVYNVKRTIKINKRNSTDTTVTLSEKREDGFYPLESKDVNSRIKEIIGIEYGEFCKCIILPQNEFAAFVKSQARDRLTLVSKLFNLEKYDLLLINALKRRRLGLMNDLSGVEGELKQFEKFTDEYVDSKTSSLEVSKALLADADARIKENDAVLDAGASSYALKNAFDDNEKKIQQLLEEKESIDRERGRLEKGDLAREVCELNRVYQDSKKSEMLLLSDKKDKIVELENTDSEIERVKGELAKDRSGKIAELNKHASALRANLSVIDDIEDLRKNYVSAKQSFLKESDNKTLILRDLGHLSKKIQGFADEEELLDSLLDKVGAGVLGRELVSQKVYFKEKLSAIEPYEGAALYDLVHQEINRKISEIESRLAEVPSDVIGVDELSAEIENIRSRSKERSDIADRIAELKSGLALTEERIKSLDENMKRLLQEGESKKSLLLALSEEVGSRVTDKNSFVSALNAMEAEIKALESEHSRLVVSERNLLSKRSDLLVEIALIKEKYSVVHERYEVDRDRFQKALEGSPFSSSEEATPFVLDESEVLKYNLRIENYDNSFKSAMALKDNLTLQLSVQDFDEERYLDAKDQKEELVNKKNLLLSDVSVLTRDVAEAVEKRKEAEAVRSRRDEISSRLNLCDKLDKVLANHNLLDYIAEEYLSDICFNASQTLLMLTSGRYDLVYEGEFFIADNSCSGDRRAMTTLSGGETFLVSLSLALALSQAICEKSNRPAEFFFLDEGFGSLDADLTETVINSLERLRSAHFAIGVISHVPELRQRVSSKIVVSPATTAHGSKIEIIV